MNYFSKINATFHEGSGFNDDGIEKKPFAKITIDQIVSRDLVDKICELMRDEMHDMGQSCTIKIQSEYWDC